MALNIAFELDHLIALAVESSRSNNPECDLWRALDGLAEDIATHEGCDHCRTPMTWESPAEERLKKNMANACCPEWLGDSLLMMAVRCVQEDSVDAESLRLCRIVVNCLEDVIQPPAEGAVHDLDVSAPTAESSPNVQLAAALERPSVMQVQPNRSDNVIELASRRASAQQPESGEIEAEVDISQPGERRWSRGRRIAVGCVGLLFVALSVFTIWVTVADGRYARQIKQTIASFLDPDVVELEQDYGYTSNSPSDRRRLGVGTDTGEDDEAEAETEGGVDERMELGPATPLPDDDRGRTPTLFGDVLYAHAGLFDHIDLRGGAVGSFSKYVDLQIVRDDERGAELELGLGLAKLSIPEPGGDWIINSGGYTVMAVGTIFSVYTTKTTVTVTVERGKVLITGGTLPKEGRLLDDVEFDLELPRVQQPRRERPVVLSASEALAHIEQALRARLRPELRKCNWYNHGRIVVQMTVGLDGQVVEAEIIEDTLEGLGVDYTRKCIIRRVMESSFPVRVGKALKVEVEKVF